MQEAEPRPRRPLLGLRPLDAPGEGVLLHGQLRQRHLHVRRVQEVEQQGQRRLRRHCLQVYVICDVFIL